ncbi:uncharacterized protein ALTATR162_LOCUS1204 [Alternaria atra]|jgi:hypothetical protein|uniref:DUF8021 domain-containing protein n=1 Tax=Alternaria atra TaxID=119953 RepID=A0A8J2HTQ4_9PLEO|nr:uncharacterized protein ALTATR162_LOCUS1204 [Alternaria atra]CAG5142706.1 unnamed protein product [Alternaria atra]
MLSSSDHGPPRAHFSKRNLASDLARMQIPFQLRLPIAVAIFAATTSSAECTREGLLTTAQSYLAAQTAGNPSTLSLASTNFTYLQNNRASDIATGLLSIPFIIDLNRSTADIAACASYTMWISASGTKPHVVGTQIRHTDNDTSIISSIDTVAATTGDLFFDAAKTLSYIRAETWSTLPASSQPSRALLKSIGDAYLDMWTNATAADTIPWGTRCERVEGSMYTNPCGGSLPHGGSQKVNGMRRYVIDETIGSVQVSCQFDSLGPWPDSHEIRVEEGKVRYVHTVTVLKGVGS